MYVAKVFAEVLYQVYSQVCQLQGGHAHLSTLWCTLR